MKFRILQVIFLSFFINIGLASAEGPGVEFFNPQGVVKGVRQVSVRFSEQMVTFGDPFVEGPFDIKCLEKGNGRWMDGKNWEYDFDRDLPAGVVCEFNLKPGIKTLSNKDLTGQKTFTFSTGGPSIIYSEPREGSDINEDQVFLLKLDAQPVEESVLSNVRCSIEGIDERVGVRILKDKEREEILKVWYENEAYP
ncbi:MAG: hypothetical protein IT393_07650 [Nitrospirae bacterium]|nr:hypothetical protein [Nitrospirota bacterium]